MEITNIANRVDNQDADEREICISCLMTNAPGTHFCEHCGTPLTSYAATGPFESIFAEGDMWRKAASQGRWAKPVRYLLIGFLLLIILSLLAGLFIPR